MLNNCNLEFTQTPKQGVWVWDEILGLNVAMRAKSEIEALDYIIKSAREDLKYIKDRALNRLELVNRALSCLLDTPNAYIINEGMLKTPDECTIDNPAAVFEEYKLLRDITLYWRGVDNKADEALWKFKEISEEIW
jgi:hypothetical protein